jgi:NitT/TauT family transport system permease protein
VIAASPLTVILLSLAIGIALLVALARGTSRAARIAAPVVFGALVLWLWQVACEGYGVPSVLLPTPTDIAVAFWHGTDLLGEDFVQTVLRAMLPGYAIGCAGGLLAALLLDRSDFLRRGVLPIASLVAVMPIIGIAPIMVMWFGFDWPSKAAVVVLMTFFPMLVNALAGLADAGSLEAQLMHSYAAGRLQTLLKLRLPAALPFVFNALKLNFTLALIGAIIAEFFGSPVVGMGFRISTEVAKMDLGLVWAEIAMAAVIGCGGFALIGLVERVVTFWHPSVRA